MNTLNFAWLSALRDVLIHGDKVSPRGKLTVEIPQRTMVMNMRYPVLTVAERKLSYKFMAAEAYWILTGDNRVETIAPYNKRIAEFSDDGQTFFGAYGPRIADQLDYVVNKLRSDPDTRQAGLTIWRENPPETKDVPCTVAIFVNIRDNKLNVHVFMRSSDLWLGVPYDVFNFSMLGHLICARLNEEDNVVSSYVEPGNLYLTAASSHLYETNWKDADMCCRAAGAIDYGEQVETPDFLFHFEEELITTLEVLRDSSIGSKLRWWEGD